MRVVSINHMSKFWSLVFDRCTHLRAGGAAKRHDGCETRFGTVFAFLQMSNTSKSKDLAVGEQHLIGSIERPAPTFTTDDFGFAGFDLYRQPLLKDF